MRPRHHRPLASLLLAACLAHGLASCSRSVVFVDTCGPVPGQADRLEVSFRDEQGSTGTASFTRDAASTYGNSTSYTAAAIAYLVITLPLTRLVARLETRQQRART